MSWPGSDLTEQLPNLKVHMKVFFHKTMTHKETC